MAEPENRNDGPRSSARRTVLLAAASGVGAFVLGGSKWLSGTSWFPNALWGGAYFTREIQTLMASPRVMVPEYGKADIAPVFRPNGTTDPRTPEYVQWASNDFRDWRLQVRGLVEHPLDLSLAQLRRLPSQTQITRHDCVEGWSCIGEWTGVRLAQVLALARPRKGAKFVVFFCADKPGNSNNGMLHGTGQNTRSSIANYYESLGLTQALHPQTLLAYELNGNKLPIANGAPLRLRVPLQLGYKMAKYLMRIEVVGSFRDIAGGHGGYWEDRGYEWYAGI